MTDAQNGMTSDWCKLSKQASCGYQADLQQKKTGSCRNWRSTDLIWEETHEYMEVQKSHHLPEVSNKDPWQLTFAGSDTWHVSIFPKLRMFHHLAKQQHPQTERWPTLSHLISSELPSTRLYRSPDIFSEKTKSTDTIADGSLFLLWIFNKKPYVMFEYLLIIYANNMSKHNAQMDTGQHWVHQENPRKGWSTTKHQNGCGLLRPHRVLLNTIYDLLLFHRFLNTSTWIVDHSFSKRQPFSQVPENSDWHMIVAYFSPHLSQKSCQHDPS